jgi:hypothetical protein
MVDARFPLMTFHIDFFFSAGAFPRKNDVPKRSSLLGIQKVPETQKYVKTRILILQS